MPRRSRRTMQRMRFSLRYGNPSRRSWERQVRPRTTISLSESKTRLATTVQIDIVMDETVGEEDDEVLLEQTSPTNPHQGESEHNKKDSGLEVPDLRSPVVENQQADSALAPSDLYPPIRLPAQTPTATAEMPPPPPPETIPSEMPRSTAPQEHAPSPAPETNNDADETERQTLLHTYQGAKICTLRMKETHRPTSVEIQTIGHTPRYR